MTHILHQMFVYYMENPSELSEKFRPADDSVEARAHGGVRLPGRG
jgi:hypothetical protein